jgi:hypothetical protein
MYTYGITGSSINEFGDVTITGVLNGQILQYNTSTGQWENVTPSGGSSDLDGLTDVVITSPAEFQVLEYNGTNWINKYASVATEVRNVDTVTLATGTAVYLFGATGDIATVKRADNDSDTTSSKVVGLVGAPIAQNQSGPVITRGYVDGIDLSVGYTAGDILWLAEDGGFTKVKPVAPEHTVFLGVVCRANANGIVYVATQNGYELDELHNVAIDAGTLADGDVLTFDDGTGLWVNAPASGGAATLNDLTDVTITSATDTQVLRYDSTTSGWRNEDPFLQTPVDLKWHYPIENQTITYNSTFFGNASRIVFDTACSITDIGIVLNATFSGGTTNTWRLGIYRDNGSNYPGSLEVDAGTISITTGATAGIKNITLGTPVSVAAHEIIWLVISLCSNGGSPFPVMVVPFGHAAPYRNNGVAGTYLPSAVGYSYGGASGTALPATFSAAAGATGAGAPLVLVKVDL